MIYNEMYMGGVLVHADRANHKYIKKERTKNGKWRYFYTMADYLKDRKALNTLQRKNSKYYYVFGPDSGVQSKTMQKDQMRIARETNKRSQHEKDKANKASWMVENAKNDIQYYWDNGKVAPQEMINTYTRAKEDMDDYNALAKWDKDISNKAKDRAKLAVSEGKIADRERKHYYKQKREVEDLTKKVWKYESKHKIKAKVADKIEKALNKLKKKH